MRPCISQATTLSSSFAEDMANFASAGCKIVEVWLTKLEQHLDRFPASDVLKAVADHEIQFAAAAYQGGLLLTQGEERKLQFEHFKRRLDLCQTLGIPTLLIAPDFVSRIDSQSLERSIVSLVQAAQWAAGFGVRLALEFRGTDTFCTCLDTAISLVEQCREPNVGICLDVFHYYKGPSKHEDLDRLTPSNLFHVQVSDVAGQLREIMTDADRVMPGDGDFDLRPIVRRLKAIGYTGAVSLELLSPELWPANPKQVLEVGLTALDRFLSL